MKIVSSGADALFEQYTIKEIQDIGKKLKNEIEKKKEELRQMVGERYRDLMEAADTITDMKAIAGNVTEHIRTMQDHCSQFQQCNIQFGIVQMARKKVMDRRQNYTKMYSIAAQMKILMDTPTKIWALMEDKDYLNCAMLYLLACHTHASLLLDPQYKLNDSSLNSTFPVIDYQWAAITSFHNILLQNCQNVLETVNTSNKMTEHLCCLILMMDITTDEVFDMFLRRRLNALEKMFQIQDQQEKSAKSQVLDLILLLTNTLNIANDIFYPHHKIDEIAQDKSQNLLLKMLHNITSKSFQGPLSLLDLKNYSPFKYLPSSITGLRPTLKKTLTTLSEEEIKTICEAWILRANEVIQKGLKELLQYIKSIKGLAAIHQSVTEQLEEMSSEWTNTCQNLLNKEINVWGMFLRPIFIDRVKAIISSQLEVAIYSTMNDIDKTLNSFKCLSGNMEHYENELTKYVWCESQSDLSPGLGWLPHSQRQLWDSGNIGMKAKGYTPGVQNICKGLDKMLQTLVEDLSHFTSQNAKVSSIDKGFYFMSKSITKLNFEDTPEINSYLMSITEEHLKKLLNNIKDQIEKRNSDEESCKFGLLFLGQLCCSLIDLCPHLKLCLLPFSNTLEFYSHKTPNLDSSIKQEEWQQVTSTITEHSNMAYRTWYKLIVKNRVNKLSQIINDCSPSGILRYLVQWDKIEIQEESEDGSVVKSTVYLPLQASACLQSILYELCCNINKAGGHALNRSVTQEFVLELFHLVLPIYDDASQQKILDNPHLSQTRALQLMFDANFMLGLMGPKENSNHPLHNFADKILMQLENQIDPFDLNVFTPLLQTNLKKVVHRSMLMLGLLTPVELVVPMGGSRSSSQPTHSEQHNLLPVSNIAGRFSLLPIVSKTLQQPIKTDDSGELSPLKSIRVHGSSPNLSNTTNSTPVTKSASFYDRMTAMSSSWFGGQ